MSYNKCGAKGIAFKRWKFNKEQMMKDLVNKYLMIELKGIKCELDDDRHLVLDPLMFDEYY